ncbi:MAG: DUF4982 domain-containing protein [Xanthomonadales bacterium]|nr:DUF4982 domain-containing protein [Xanthomonadales bacterium]
MAKNLRFNSRYPSTSSAAIGWFLSLCFCLTGSLWASDSVQKIPGATGDVLLNEGWDYYENPAAEPADLEGVAAYRVSLPHSWNALDATDAEPGYRRDASWYRKLLKIPPETDPMRYLLYLEGANMRADVYVNGQRAGGHVGGYLGFEVDITDHLEFDGSEEVLVRVDNGIDRDLIQSQKADYELFGGLTRDVFLRVRPAIHISAVQADTPRVSADSAEVKGKVYIRNTTGAKRDHFLKFEIMDEQGDSVAKARLGIVAGEGEDAHTIPLMVVENPDLWSTDDPHLYTLKTALTDEDGAELHATETTVGLRWFGFAENGAFLLNGERLLLRGTHRHEEHAGYGAAMPNELHVRDMEMIKEMGANFVRLGHYPQDPSVYRAADRLGLILWDELPWNRGGMGGDEWKANSERMLREMIQQNRNHPSVFFWSLGNEIYWLPDFEGGDDEEAMNEFLRHLNAVAHELDPSRMTTIRKYYAGWDIVDVFSPSIWAGWYGGGYSQYAEALTEAQQKYPRFLHMEYGGSSHVGRHSWNPPGGNGLEGGQASVEEMVNQSGVVSVAKGGDWSESYIVDLFDWHLLVSESQPDFAGNAQWAFKDFATPLRPENPIPYMNQKGLVDREGRPKEAYWVFKSRWSDAPFCHIYGHSWRERHGEAGSSQQIRAYCNTATAQLFVNGEAQGEKQRDLSVFPAGGLFWDVNLAEGKNRLRVVGRSGDDNAVEDLLEIEYTEQPFGKVAEIRLQAHPREDGLVLIEAVVVDSEGRRVHSASERVYFSNTNAGGGGMLLQAHGTPDKSAVIELANGRAAILFDPRNGGFGSVIEARTQNLKGNWIRVGTSGGGHGEAKTRD